MSSKCFYIIPLLRRKRYFLISNSCNTERLIFESCNIHCSTALDFGSALKYNIRTLSFQGWGDTSDSAWKTDWNSSPLSFDNIIEAISNSGLKDSLETISIDKNQTLSVKKVKQMLIEKGISNVTVNQNYLKDKNSL